MGKVWIGSWTARHLILYLANGNSSQAAKAWSKEEGRLVERGEEAGQGFMAVTEDPFRQHIQGLCATLLNWLASMEV